MASKLKHLRKQKHPLSLPAKHTWEKDLLHLFDLCCSLKDRTHRNLKNVISPSRSACPGVQVLLPSSCTTSQLLSVRNKSSQNQGPDEPLEPRKGSWNQERGAGPLISQLVPGQAVFLRSASQVVHGHLLHVSGRLDVVGIWHQVR